MTGKVKDLRRTSVYYTAQYLGANNPDNVIVINPSAPADIVGKLYRSPDDANTWIATQTPSAENTFALQYWAWFYDVTHTCKQWTKAKGETLQTGIAHIIADLDFDGDNFTQSVIENIWTDDLQIPTGKILACLWWFVDWWLIEWPFAWVWGAWINNLYNVDASGAPFVFLRNFDCVDSQIVWWSLVNCTLEDCVVWQWEYEFCNFVSWTTAVGAAYYDITWSSVDADFLASIPAWSNVILQNCTIEWNAEIPYSLVMVNCSSLSGASLEVVGAGEISSAGLVFIDIVNTNWWWIANVWETIDNASFTNLTETDSQALFQEIDTLIWWWNSPDFYIYTWSTPSWRLYADWELLYDASNVWQGIKNIRIGNNWLSVQWGVNSAAYNISNYYLRAYKSSTGNDQIWLLDFTKGVSDDFTIWLPKYVKDIYLTYNNNFAPHNPFYAFTNTADSYPRFDIDGRATIACAGTQVAFQVGDMWSTCDLHIYVRDFATLTASWQGMFKLYDANSRIHIHVFDNATISWDIVANTFVSWSWSVKDNVLIHIYSPTVNISQDLIDTDLVTVVFHGIWKQKEQINSLQEINDTITDVTRNDTLKQATYTGTFSWLSVGDWIEVDGMTPSDYNVLWQIIDFPTMTTCVIQFPSWVADPWSYVSGGTWRLKTVVKLWSNRNVWFTTGYLPTGSWFTRGISWQLAANGNVKKIKLIAQDRYNGNVGVLYENADIAANTWIDAAEFAIEWHTKIWYDSSVVSTTKETVVSVGWFWVDLGYRSNGMQLQNTDLLLVLDGVWLQDFIIYNLYSNPV